jgi:predicted acyltransferase
LGIIFVGLMVFTGYIWMTAQGDEQKVTKAKDTLQMAIIGLVIVLAAYSITYFVFKGLSWTSSSGVLTGS